MFKNPFSFEGRIRRLEFGLTYLAYFAFLLVLEMLTSYFLPEDNPITAIVILLAYIPILWLLFAQAAKRCHDRGNSGWYQLIPFYALWLLFADSDYGNNEYGENPKGQGNIDEIDEIGNYLPS